ncbi:hypothetical protein F4776DRAFT_664426 [Hypoxylon sp. NC0597]|nr:hypothetical protein F4776DRAFT_664426 [Hypoxylon sp. NC0597]
MDHAEAQYTGLEPPDPFSHIPNFLETVNFDAQEAPTDEFSFESHEPPSSQQNVALPSNSTEPYSLPIQNSVSAPAADKPVDEANSHYIDPRNLSNDNGITDIAFQQNNQDTKNSNNGGNTHPPVGNFPGPTNYPLNDIQYHHLHQPNGAYLGFEAVRAPYPAQRAPYPVEGSAYVRQESAYPVQGPSYTVEGPVYPVRGPSYPVQRLMYPAQVPGHPAQGPGHSAQGPPYPTQAMYSIPGTPYSVPQALPMTEAAYPLPQTTLTMPPPTGNIQQSSLGHRTNNQISFDSKEALDRRQRSRLPSPIIIYHHPPLKRPARGLGGELLKNDRIPRVTRKNQEKPDPREWYGPLLPQPDNWGPKDKTGRSLFKYTEYGELERGRTYSTKEMRWFMYGPKRHEVHFDFPMPLKGVPEVQNKVRQALTIWIGWVPPQSNERYPYGAQSQRCRFADCPDPNQTIRSGFPRVVFDERMNMDGEVVDPFHNSGYAHLYCFERHFDLIQAMVRLDVRADYRNFKREENLGKLSRYHPEIQNELENWWRDEHPRYLELGKDRNRSYEHSLSYRLVCHVLAHSSEGRIKMRELRGGADMSKHKGDLVKQQFLKDCMQHDLVDEDGDPIPDAREELERIRTGKRNRKAMAKRLGARRNKLLTNICLDHRDDVTMPPTPATTQQAPSPYDAVFSPEAHGDYDEVMPTTSLYQEQLIRKRKMDQVQAEDQDIDMTHYDGHEPVRERPVTRQQNSPMVISDLMRSARDAPTADNEIPPQAGPGEGGPGRTLPSPARSMDALEFKEGHDLFGDVALEVEMLDAEIKQEPEDDD